ncbi:ribonuclease HI [Dehalobacter sp. DCM]|uniref:ribonuclease HI n=1 Tax=Dehalobacter sp. DCM TaxID=2907827 RepID=UPI00308216D1|nr:ribonuclease HI [Dehalobacter sp. DCM]
MSDYDKNTKTVKIYTDGACSGNPGPGGWGAILKYGENTRELNGFEANTTNQRMELTAAVQALSALKEPCRAELHSDSAYLINAFEQKWLVNWQRNGWLNSQKKPVENKDLWVSLLELAKIHHVTWIKVKGHAGHPENERCDELARRAISEARAKN